MVEGVITHKAIRSNALVLYLEASKERDLLYLMSVYIKNIYKRDNVTLGAMAITPINTSSVFL